MLVVTNANPYYGISQVVEDAVIARLTDLQTGFLPIATKMAAAAELTLPTLDFSADSGHLYRAEISIADFLAADNPVLPAFLVFIAQTEDKHLIVGKTFSGSVNANISIYLSQEGEDYPLYLQKIANLYTDAMYHTFGIDNCFALNAAGINLNGGLRISRSCPVRDKADNWFMALNVGLPLFLN